jgi:ArsR family transcriptional regulator, arsenate/arsenite/antimonite-responsive transcriptional repressor
VKVAPEAELALLKALGDPVRWHFLAQLSTGKTSEQSDLEDLTSVSRPTVSHHMKILRDAGLVRMEKKGRKHRYTVEAEPLSGLVARMEQWLVEPGPESASEQARGPRAS